MAVAVLAGTLVQAAGLASAGEPPPNAPIVVTIAEDVNLPDDGETSLREAFDLADAQPGADEVLLVPDAVHHIATCDPDSSRTTMFAQDAAPLTIDGRGATIDTECPSRLLDFDNSIGTVRHLTLTGDAQEAAVAMWVDGGEVHDLTIEDLASTDPPYAGNDESVVITGGTVDLLRIERTAGFGFLVVLTGSDAGADDVVLRDNEALGGLWTGYPVALQGLEIVGNAFEAAATDLYDPGTVHGSAIVDNEAVGLRTRTGVTSGPDTAVTLVNTTISGNQAPEGEPGGIDATAPIDLVHTTVADNDDGTTSEGQVSAPELTSTASIIASSTEDVPQCDVATTTSQGGNVDDGSCGFDQATDRTYDAAVGPGLAPAAGDVPWRTPAPASPAVDALPTPECTQDVDQRGLTRPEGPACDAGAVELEVADVTFTDVAATHTFHAEITWLAGVGVTDGWPDGSYRPAAALTRQALAAFLHRFAGDDAVDPPVAPTFSDVPAEHPFFLDVEWLAQQSLSTGWPDDTFRPGATLTRQALAAFLHRFAGDDPVDPPVAPTFSDVPAEHPFFLDVEWLAGTGMAGGWADGTFRPAATVTRQALAAFLYRFAHT